MPQSSTGRDPAASTIPSPSPLQRPGPDSALPLPVPIGPVTTPGPLAVLPERNPRARKPGQPIPSHFPGCFGCGMTHPSGLHLQAFAGTGLDITARLEITADHQGAAGLAHGGLLAAALDEAMGALHWLLMKPAVTARLEVDYVAPVPVGSEVQLVARITGVSGRKIYTAAVAGIGDRVILRASAIFVQVPSSHFRPYDREPSQKKSDLEVNP